MQPVMLTYAAEVRIIRLSLIRENVYASHACRAIVRYGTILFASLWVLSSALSDTTTTDRDSDPAFVDVPCAVYRRREEIYTPVG